MSTVKTKATYPQGGTGLETLGTAGQVLKTNSGATGFEWGEVSGSSFGGDGADGALSVTSGTTNLDAATSQYLVKNYSSITISSGATLGLSNPASNGTVLILKSQGDVTIEGTIDLQGDGSAAGTANLSCLTDDGGQAPTGITGGLRYVNRSFYTTPDANRLSRQMIVVCCGAGGANGGTGTGNYGPKAGGAGGRGGGALIIECGGTLNFASGASIDIDGANGTAGTSAGDWQGGGGGGGGGGSSGMALIIYNELTANSGTVSAKGGAGANGGTGSTSWGGGSAVGGSGGGGGGAYQEAGKTGGTGGTTAVNATNGTATSTSAGASGGGGGGDSSHNVAGTGGSSSGATTTDHYLITSKSLLW